MIKKLLLPFFLFLVQDCFGQPTFQLAPPLLKYNSAFFSGNTFLEIIFNQPGAEVRYTLNGDEPAENDQLYSNPIPISKRTEVKVKTFGKHFQPSETVSVRFIQNGKSIRNIQFSKPHESYANNKTDILYDNVGGIANYGNGNWLGYDSDTVEINIDLQKKEAIKSVLISLLQDENSWIFLPEQILVYYYSRKRNAFMPGVMELFMHETPGVKQCNFRELSFIQKNKTNKLKLVLLPLKKIPGWHAGKGNHAWLFIDEIKVY